MLRHLSALFLGLTLAVSGFVGQATALTGPDATITVHKGGYTNLSSVTAGNTGLIASVPAQAGATYVWTVTGANITAGDGTNAITLTDTAKAGNTVSIGVTVTDAMNVSAVGSKNLTVLPAPSTDTITTAADITEGGASHSIAATSVAGATYAWQATAGVTYTSTGLGSTSYTTTATNGTANASATVLSLSCKITNPDGATGTISKSVNVWAAPTQPFVVTTQNDGTTAEFQVTASTTGHKAHVAAQNNVTYTWSVVDGSITAGQGTTEITYTAGATAGSSALKVTCSAANKAGTAVPSFATQDVIPAPNATITVSKGGYTNLSGITAGNAGIVASVPALAGMTYAWTVTGGNITAGAGTNAITFTDTAKAGTTVAISVTVTNSLGAQANGSKNLAVLTAPGAATITTAADITQGGASHAISATAISGATYAWQATSGVAYASTTAGATTYTTTLTNGTANASATVMSLSCKIINPDGVTGTISKSVNVWAPPATPTVVTTQNDGTTPETQVDASTTGHKAHVAAQNNVTYAWTMIDGSITAGQGTREITFTAGASAGIAALKATCTVTNKAGTAASASATEDVIGAPNTTITVSKGAFTNLSGITAGNTGIVASVPAQVGATYAWSVTGGNITAGAGTHAITFTDTAKVGNTVTISVTVTNSMAASANGSKNLAVLTAPGAATISTAANITEGGSSHAIAATAIAGATYAWQPTSGVVYASTSAGSTTYTTSVTNLTGNTSAAVIGLSCKITNPDGATGTISKNVSIWAMPATPYVQTYKSDDVTFEWVVTANTTGHRAHGPAVPANTTYTWSVSNGSVTGGQGTNLLTFTAGSTLGNPALTVTLTASNPAGGSASSSANEAVCAVPSAAITVSKGLATNLSAVTEAGTGFVAQVPDLGTGASYTWSATGANITAGSGTHAITLTNTTAAGGTITLNVTATNWAGDAASGGTILNSVAAPAITGFAPTAHSVVSGNSGTLMATFTGGTGLVDQGVGAVTSGVGASTAPLTSTTSFVLTVTNAAGDSVTANAAVTVPQVSGTAGNMTKAREYATQTPLPNGKVLIAGGYNATDGYLNSIELYDPQTGTFTTSASHLTTARQLHTATLLPNGKVLIVGGQTSGNSALGTAELYDYTTDTVGSTGSLMNGRSYHSATLMPTGKVLVAGGSGASVLSSVEIYDPKTGSFSQPAGSALKAARTEHTATLLPNGKVLLSGGISNVILSSAELFDPTTNTSALTGSLGTARYLHTATLMPNGKVLVSGGYNSGYLASAELYDPQTGAFSLSAHTLSVGRIYHTSILMRNGLVLIAGGDTSGAYLSSCDLYDPATDAFTATASLPISRSFQTSSVLPDGRVLMVGGIGGTPFSTYLNTAVLYDPSEPNSGTWNQIGSMHYQRQSPVATLLPNGKVLISGGTVSLGVFVAQCELFDPQTNTYSLAASLGTARIYHAATLLPNGKVLITGGTDSSNTNLSSAELYDPKTDTFTSAGNMTEARRSHTATVLPNGKVLFTGAVSSPSLDIKTELYDPSTGTFTATGNMTVARWLNSATLLPNGKVLISGGRSGGFDVATTELYDYQTGTFTASGSMGTVRETHVSTLLPNGKVLLAGGYANYPNTPTLAELYDPQTGTCTPTGSLASGRYAFSWSPTADGKVLLVGGYNAQGNLNTTEVYDPVAGTFSTTGNIKTPYEYNMGIQLLPNGKILMMGGYDIAVSSESQIYQ